MIIHIHKISATGSTYTGELEPEFLDLQDDKFIRPKGAVRYSLEAEIISEQVIVRGNIETELDLLCVVCADFFSTKVRVSSFLRAYPIEQGLETIDLIGDIREDILLEVPPYPRGETEEREQCRRCGRDLKPAALDSDAGSASEIWDPLDRLKW